MVETVTAGKKAGGYQQQSRRASGSQKTVSTPSVDILGLHAVDDSTAGDKQRVTSYYVAGQHNTISATRTCTIAGLALQCGLSTGGLNIV